jgi:hypothetical protein
MTWWKKRTKKRRVKRKEAERRVGNQKRELAGKRVKSDYEC